MDEGDTLPSEQGFSLCQDSEWKSQDADEGRNFKITELHD